MERRFDVLIVVGCPTFLLSEVRDCFVRSISLRMSKLPYRRKLVTAPFASLIKHVLIFLSTDTP